jgi:hypothetical protein
MGLYTNILIDKTANSIGRAYGAIYAKALTGFEGESLGCLGEKSILCGAGAWVDKTVGKYTIELVLQGVGRVGVVVGFVYPECFKKNTE